MNLSLRAAAWFVTVTLLFILIGVIAGRLDNESDLRREEQLTREWKPPCHIRWGTGTVQRIRRVTKLPKPCLVGDMVYFTKDDTLYFCADKPAWEPRIGNPTQERKVKP